jgi:hypothetical protein
VAMVSVVLSSRPLAFFRFRSKPMVVVVVVVVVFGCGVSC